METDPRVRVFERLVRAYREGASEVHFEPFEGRIRVRSRSAHGFREIDSWPRRMAPWLASHLGKRAGLDVSEKRRPQQGTLRLHPGAPANPPVDLTLSLLPLGDGGIRICIRFSPPPGPEPDPGALGFSPEARAGWNVLTGGRSGLVLHAGPPGSGRTTALHASARAHRPEERLVLSAEDPLERRMAGIVQTEADEARIGGMAAILYAFRRQRPDVVLAGRIPDAESALRLIELAESGVRVFAVSAATDGASALEELFLRVGDRSRIAAALTGVCELRLLPGLCSCAEPGEPSADARARWQSLGGTRIDGARRPVGCPQCAGSGFSGQVPVHGIVLPGTSDGSAWVRARDAGGRATAIRAAARLSRFTDASAKIREGKVALETCVERVP